MCRTLQARLVAAFVSLALGSIALVSLLINFTVERRFEQYVRETITERAVRIARSLAAAYDPARGWSPEFLMEITHWSLMERLDITLEYPPGRVIWQSAATNLGQGLLPEGDLPAPDASLPDLSLRQPVVAGGREIAVLWVRSGPRGMYTEHDLHFRAGLNQVLLVSALTTAAIAFATAWLLSRSINRPLMEMTRVAVQMRTGDWNQRVPLTGITELQQLGEALNHLAVSLQQHEEMRRRMTRDVAHELRTPLAVLRSHLEAIQDGIWEPTPDRIRLCHQAVMRLVRLVDDLGQLAEAESDALHLEGAEMALSDLLDPLASSYEPLFAQKQITFRYQAPPAGVRVWVDRDRASQVVLNLLSNAHKYTPPGGQVTLGAAATDQEVRISVRDTGPGIPPEDLPRIFERFYRGDPARSTDQGGAGLGLAIAKALAEAHGGRIEVTSCPGQGSEFVFVLPRIR